MTWIELLKLNPNKWKKFLQGHTSETGVLEPPVTLASHLIRFSLEKSYWEIVANKIYITNFKLSHLLITREWAVHDDYKSNKALIQESKIFIYKYIRATVKIQY